MTTIRIGSRRYTLPASRLVRTVIGVFLILAGLLGFLPVLGFWMIPLGLLVLSVDFPIVRRWRRRLEVKLGDWLVRRYPAWAKRLGFNGDGNSARYTRRAGNAANRRAETGARGEG
jgi:purine-cytosine permease-like protein